jgi:phytoene dehydrogenase-like protein
MREYDAVIVGAGPNGLSAAIELARNDQRVLVVEGRETVGGGSRTAELTLEGFRHDVCSAVFALGHASPFFKTLPLADHGLEWIQPEIPVAQATDDGAVALYRDVDRTADELGSDGDAYRKLMQPLTTNPDKLYETVLGPIIRFPSHPVFTARFGLVGLPSARMLTRRFREQPAKALIAGLAGHATTALTTPLTGAMALVMGAAAHTEGYPVARGGSQAVADALSGHLLDLGGDIETGRWIGSLDELPDASAYLLNLMPGAVAAIGGERIDRRVGRKLQRWRHGPATFKVDYATSAPIPWHDDRLRRAGTVHVGGAFEEVAAAEAAPWKGGHAEHPFLILVQPTIVDPSRAPQGGHTVWVYAHVPNGSDTDITDRIEAQIERFAPGFGDTVLDRHVMTPSAFADYNPNNVGGDIAAGRFGFWRIVARPRLSLDPYRIGEDVYLCSAAAPPGVGVHGMSGYHAARSALRRLRPR